MSKLVFGVGINDADYSVTCYENLEDGKRRQVWMCPFYRAWKNMMARGYSRKEKTKHPTYKDVTLCQEWLLFSNFSGWMQTQDWEGKQLDKDLLVNGNKVYGPENCVFVSAEVNKFLTDRGNDRGEHKIGVHWAKNVGKFMARCSNPFTGKRDSLGLFSDEDEAHNAWLAKKLEHAKVLASLQTDARITKALIAKYENYGELNE